MKYVNTSRTAIATVSAGLVSAALGMPLAALAQANPCAAGTPASSAANPCQATRRFDPLTTSGIDPLVNQLSDVIGVGAAAFCRRPLRRLSRSR